MKRKATEQMDQDSVYIFHLGFRGVYKVGYSRNWKQRLKSLQAGNPNITPVLVIAGTKVLEKAIHRAWKGFRLERETFAFYSKGMFEEAKTKPKYR